MQDFVNATSEMRPGDRLILKHSRMFLIGGAIMIGIGALVVWTRPGDDPDFRRRQDTINAELQEVDRMPRLQRYSVGRDAEGGLDIEPIGEALRTPEQIGEASRVATKQFQLELDRNNREGFSALQAIGGAFVSFLGVIAIVSALAVRRQASQYK